jgi:hypothetical protein
VAILAGHLHSRIERTVVDLPLDAPPAIVINVCVRGAQLESMKNAGRRSSRSLGHQHLTIHLVGRNKTLISATPALHRGWDPTDGQPRAAPCSSPTGRTRFAVFAADRQRHTDPIFGGAGFLACRDHHQLRSVRAVQWDGHRDSVFVYAIGVIPDGRRPEQIPGARCAVARPVIAVND